MQGTRINGRNLIKYIIPLIVLFLLVLVDQLTKLYVKNLHELSQWQSTTVINGFFYFTYAFNSGAAFSFLADVSWGQTFFKVLTIFALIVFIVILVYSFKKNKKFLNICMVFIIAGTLGNFIDRLAYDGVVDFISLIFGSYSFPIFNFADICIVISVVLILISTLKGDLWNK